MAVKWTRTFILGLICLVAAACATVPTPTRIALLAPFEGRYREIGYDALYAARLALQETGTNQIELLPVDDGGTVTTAVDRAQALYEDSQVVAALVLGYAATSSDTLGALGDIPVLVVGDWGALPLNENIFILSSPEIEAQMTVPLRMGIIAGAEMDPTIPLVGGPVFALRQFHKLRTTLDNVTVISSATLPDAEFIEGYRASNQFAPQPGLLAPLTYDATKIAIRSIMNTNGKRQVIARGIGGPASNGFNGLITFANGYWQDAPIHSYIYDDNSKLTPVDRIVE